MGGFLSGGGPSQPQTPDIPVADFNQQAQQYTAGQRKAGFWSDAWTKLHAAFADGLSIVITLLAASFDDLMTLWVKFMTAAQSMSNPNFFPLASAMLSDLLGIEISSDQVEQAWRRGGVVSGMGSLGNSFVNQLLGEFATGNQITPESGLKAADAFLGFLITFSIREANMEFITSLIPEEYRFGEDIRDYAVNMARNLGLGRMARQVMMPFLKAVIQDPVTWYYNQQYRPTLLSVPEVFRGYLHFRDQ